MPDGTPPFDKLVDSLRRNGLAEEADRLHDLLHATAWTSSSEFYGELGLELKRIRRASPEALSGATEQLFEEAVRAIRAVWPGFRP